MQGKQIKVGILGGGPAGIAAAINISHISGYDVHLIDSNPRIGRKLSVTGSGRGNLTNLHLDPSRYYSTHPENLSHVLNRWTPLELRKFLNEIGIPTISTEDGWVYPASLSAANMVEILRGNLSAAGVHLMEDSKVTGLRHAQNGFEIKTDNLVQPIKVDSLLIATGSKAYPQLRADAGILSEVSKMGLKSNPFKPALSPLLLRNQELKAISGIRLDLNLTMIRDNKPISSSYGNVIFTDYGMNGPGCMNLSHLVSENEKTPTALEIDFLTDEQSKTLESIYLGMRSEAMPYRLLYLAFFPEKLTDFFLKNWKIPAQIPCSSIDKKTFCRHIHSIRHYRIESTGTKGYKDSQACVGGILLNEIDMATMQSKKIPGLFFAGEILDVVGPCGGYNLHWAFASGLTAGEAIACS